MPEMPKQNGQGEAKAHTKGGAEEAKGGAKMQKINREDVVQAALTVQRWCAEHINEYGHCDCPFRKRIITNIASCFKCKLNLPSEWGLEEHLRERGLKHGKV